MRVRTRSLPWPKTTSALLLSLACLSGAAWWPSPRPAVQQTDVDLDYQRGLELWRKPGRDNVPCAFCHSPDGIEIAAFSFSDDTIRRRARPHLPAEDAEGLVKFIHAVRKRFGMTSLLDPMVDRPMQPTGRPLKGASPQERDDAFLGVLAQQFPAFTRTPLTTSEQLAALSEALRQLDPNELPVGIEFNRLSEDKFHGLEHATIANWFADVPFLPVIPWDIIFGIQDQYIKDPSPKNLSALLDTGPERMLELSTPADQVAVHKFNSLVIYQHMLRSKAMGRAPNGGGSQTLLEAVGRPYVPNGIWDLGEFASIYSDIDLKSFHLPETIAAAKTGTYTAQEQLSQIRPGWLWCGWLLDQGFLRKDFARPEEPTPPKRTRILTSALVSDGPYVSHAIYAVARKSVVRAEKAPEVELDFGVLTPAVIEGVAEARRAPLRVLFANALLVGLHSVAEGRKRGAPLAPSSSSALDEAVRWVVKLQPESASLAESIRTVIDKPENTLGVR